MCFANPRYNIPCVFYFQRLSRKDKTLLCCNNSENTVGKLLVPKYQTTLGASIRWDAEKMRTWSIPNQIKDPVLFCGSLFWDCSLDGFHWACKHSKQLTKHCLDVSGILSLIVAHILDYARTWLANVVWWRKQWPSPEYSQIWWYPRLVLSRA